MSNFPRLLRIFGSAATALVVLQTSAFAASGEHMGGGDWWTPLDHYCERIGVAYWAEPMNAITNGAFLLAAGLILERQRRFGWTDRPLMILAVLTATVGIGSFLFHTTPTGLTLLADIVPIAVVILSFFFLAMRRFLGRGPVVAGLATAALLLLAPQLGVVMQPILGASSAYAPGLVATFGVAVAVPLFGRGRMPPLLVAAGAAFSVALVFRILDAPMCSTWPIGTHFLWHTFNGIALGLALLAAERVTLGRAGPRTRRVASAT